MANVSGNVSYVSEDKMDTSDGDSDDYSEAGSTDNGEGEEPDLQWCTTTQKPLGNLIFCQLKKN